MLQTFHTFATLEAGTDEAGRGCLAGPVTCAAVIIDTAQLSLLSTINDSKKLSEKTRNILRPIIEEAAICFSVIHIYPEKIDQINILQASILGMQTAALSLTTKPQHFIVDGNRFNAGIHLPNYQQNSFYKYLEPSIFENQIPYSTIIKGDSKFLSIAAASILAKTYRDEYMLEIHQEFPMYNWAKNKGYPTKEHYEAIKKYGRCKYHRLSFKFKDEK
jgi:ribonuclease HII